MELVKPDAGSPSTVQVQFDGGYFTDAEDLRQLSDDEFRRLRIHTDMVEVLLSDNQSRVIGGAAKAQDVYRLWARARQLADVSVKRRLLQMARLAIVGVSLLFVAFAIVGSMYFDLLIDVYLWTAWPILAVQMLAALLINVVARRTPPYNSALILPFSLSEWRQMQANNKWPKWAVIVAGLSVLVAIAAIAAPLVLQ